MKTPNEDVQTVVEELVEFMRQKVVTTTGNRQRIWSLRLRPLERQLASFPAKKVGSHWLICERATSQMHHTFDATVAVQAAVNQDIVYTISSTDQCIMCVRGIPHDTKTDEAAFSLPLPTNDPTQ